jgi:5-hydroxyisourate hydrolase
MTGYLTVHILDTATGHPAVGMDIRLYRLDDGRIELGHWISNHDGRCDEPLLKGTDFRIGLYELEFAVLAWRETIGQSDHGFYDDVPIRFRITDASLHYHVPLLISPYGYSTYRGS